MQQAYMQRAFVQTCLADLLASGTRSMPALVTVTARYGNALQLILVRICRLSRTADGQIGTL